MPATLTLLGDLLKQASYAHNGSNLRVKLPDIKSALRRVAGRGVNRIMPYQAGRSVPNTSPAGVSNPLAANPLAVNAMEASTPLTEKSGNWQIPLLTAGAGGLAAAALSSKKNRLRNALLGAIAGGAGGEVIRRLSALQPKVPAPNPQAEIAALEQRAAGGDFDAYKQLVQTLGADPVDAARETAGHYAENLNTAGREAWDKGSTPDERVARLENMTPQQRENVRVSDAPLTYGVMNTADATADYGLGLAASKWPALAGLRAFLSSPWMPLNFTNPQQVRGDSWTAPWRWGSGQAAAMSHLAQVTPIAKAINAAPAYSKAPWLWKFLGSTLNAPNAARLGTTSTTARILGNRLGAAGTLIGTFADGWDWNARGKQMIAAERGAAQWKDLPESMSRGFAQQQQEQDRTNASEGVDWSTKVKGNLSHVPANYANFGRNANAIQRTGIGNVTGTGMESSFESGVKGRTGVQGFDITFDPTTKGMRYVNKITGQWHLPSDFQVQAARQQQEIMPMDPPDFQQRTR